MRVTPTTLPDVLLIEPDAFTDPRGSFLIAYHDARYDKAGIRTEFVQDNVSVSGHGVLRGLHFQHPFGQGKLVQVLHGEVFDVAVDVRRTSPTFGQWVGQRLSAENRLQLYIPPGFAHGFVALAESTIFAYKCTEHYRPEAEQTIRWNDPRLQIGWPLMEVRLSDRDAGARAFDEFDVASLPMYPR